jgi:pyruvate formate lyase activating enzyme
MKIAAILKFSTLDYPGKLSCVVFCQGCPLRCCYCHNADFLDPLQPEKVSIETFISFLKNRIGLLDAVVFSGGEPLLQQDLGALIDISKSLGYLVGLHTSGAAPSALKIILPTLNWIGFDLKTSIESYENITRTKDSGKNAVESLDLILTSGINYEVRTTYDSRNISEPDLINIAKFLSKRGVSRWTIQECIIRDGAHSTRLPLPSQDAISETSTFINVNLRRA